MASQSVECLNGDKGSETAYFLHNLPKKLTPEALYQCFKSDLPGLSKSIDKVTCEEGIFKLVFKHSVSKDAILQSIPKEFAEKVVILSKNFVKSVRVELESDCVLLLQNCNIDFKKILSDRGSEIVRRAEGVWIKSNNLDNAQRAIDEIHETLKKAIAKKCNEDDCTKHNGQGSTADVERSNGENRSRSSSSGSGSLRRSNSVDSRKGRSIPVSSDTCTSPRDRQDLITSNGLNQNQSSIGTYSTSTVTAETNNSLSNDSLVIVISDQEQIKMSYRSWNFIVKLKPDLRDKCMFDTTQLGSDKCLVVTLIDSKAKRNFRDWFIKYDYDRLASKVVEAPESVDPTAFERVIQHWLLADNDVEIIKLSNRKYEIYGVPRKLDEYSNKIKVGEEIRSRGTDRQLSVGTTQNPGRYEQTDEDCSGINNKIHNGIKNTINSDVIAVLNRASSEVGSPEELALFPKLKVEIASGNLLAERTNAIVNPTDKDLFHIGMAAKSIVDAAGYSVTKECQDFMRTNGKLGVTKVMSTTAGHLNRPICHIIHACGPSYPDTYDDKRCQRLLEETFLNCLHCANDELHVDSVSIPAISAGRTGVRPDLVATAAYNAVKTFESRMSAVSAKKCFLNLVRFVNIDSEVTKCFKKKFSKQTPKPDTGGHFTSSGFDVDNPLRDFQSNGGAYRPVINAASSTAHPLDSLTTPLSNIRVEILQGDLIHQKTVAIVNPANCSLIHSGGAAKAISVAAGSSLDDECRRHIIVHRKLQVSEVMHTTSGRLYPSIKHVIHAVGPNVQDIPDIKRCQQLVGDTFYNCLLHANDTLRIESISIPAISAGIFGVPHEVVAQAAYDAVMRFDEKLSRDTQTRRYIKIINFVNIDVPITECMKAVFGELHYKNVNKNNQEGRSESESPREDVSEAAVNVVTPRIRGGSKTAGDDSSQCDNCRRKTKNLTQKSCIHFFCSNCKELSCMKCLGQSKPFLKMNTAADKGGMVSDYDSRLRSNAWSSTNEFHSLPVTSCSNKSSSADDNEKNTLDKTSSDDTCVICMDTISGRAKTLDCGHRFCPTCIDECFKHQKKCPTCGKLFGAMKGNQPAGTMTVNDRFMDVEGYAGCGSIEIVYDIPSGTQTDDHPNPSQRFKGTTRKAYLPNNTEGKQVCKLLRRAFDAKLIFTVGKSNTTGNDNCVIWNDIHHKTSYSGSHGYPDPTYLSRVKDELAAKGIKPEDDDIGHLPKEAPKNTFDRTISDPSKDCFASGSSGSNDVYHSRDPAYISQTAQDYPSLQIPTYSSSHGASRDPLRAVDCTFERSRPRSSSVSLHSTSGRLIVPQTTLSTTSQRSTATTSNASYGPYTGSRVTTSSAGYVATSSSGYGTSSTPYSSLRTDDRTSARSTSCSSRPVARSNSATRGSVGYTQPKSSWK